MPTTAVENLIVSSIHGAFIKYPEGDGGPNLDYEWIAPDQSAHIAKASRALQAAEDTQADHPRRL